jgi:uncharacterized protein YceK
MKITKIKLLTVSLAATALLSGCATEPAKTTKTESSSTTLASNIEAANNAQIAGQSEQAMTLLKSAATRFPADKAPWVRMAQIKFERADYGGAIIDSLEVLQRDPADKVANSILTVSGLRLSIKALSDLRTQNALSGTVKSETQDLAKLLRENLGETVLVPPPDKGELNNAKVRPRPVVTKARPPAAKNSLPESEAGSSNPFGGLK